MDKLRVENDALKTSSGEKDAEIKERDNKIEEKNAEIARLRKLVGGTG